MNNGTLTTLFNRLFRRNLARRTLQAGAPRLQNLGRELQRLNAGTEADFLRIGGLLQDFSARAKEIAADSAGTAGLLGGAELENAIAELGNIFKQTKLLASECETGTDILTEILRKLDLVQSSITGFMKIVKTLTVLSTFIRVESARLASMGEDFSALATEINLLGNNIEEKYKNILRESDTLSFLLKTNLSNMLNIKDNQKNQIQIIIDKTMKSLESLTEKHNLSLAATQTISCNYQNISREISDIIVSLQFHDITSQQIEHVSNVLQNVFSLLVEKRHRNGHRQQSIILARDICQIQHTQLAMARDKLTGAVGCIIENLHGISRDITAISQPVQELVGDASQDGTSFLAGMEENLATVTTGLNLYRSAREDLAGLMAALAPAISNMADFLLDIERIEIAIERIALNACIKAAHLEKSGDVMGVLAESTQNLVGETKHQTREVSVNLKSIYAAAQQLSAGQGGETAPARITEASLVAKLGEVLQTIGALNENVISGLTQVGGKGKSLSDALILAANEITVQENTEAGINRIINGISGLDKQLQDCLGDKYNSVELDDEELLKLKNQYTMADERTAHDKAILSAGPPTTQGMAASSHNEKEVGADATSDPTGLGENVELF